MEDITKELLRLIRLQERQLNDWESALRTLPNGEPPENETAEEKKERYARVTHLQVAKTRLDATSAALNAISGLVNFQSPPVQK